MYSGQLGIAIWMLPDDVSWSLWVMMVIACRLVTRNNFRKRRQLVAWFGGEIVASGGGEQLLVCR